MTRDTVHWTLIAFAFALGCTVTRQGTLQLLPGGASIPVTVTVEGDSLSLVGEHPETGERLAGRLRKVAGDEPTSEPWYPSSPTGGAPRPGGISGVGGEAGTEKTLNLSGTIEGDRGTRLRCLVAVERRLYLRGGGTCRLEAADDNAPSYRLKF